MQRMRSSAGFLFLLAAPIAAEAQEATVFPATGVLERGRQEHWVVRILLSEHRTRTGLITLLSADSVGVGTATVALDQIRRIERGHRVASSGFKVGAAIGAAAGLLFGFSIAGLSSGAAGASSGGGGTIAGLTIGGAIVGGLIGGTAARTSFRWEVLWSATDE